MKAFLTDPPRGTLQPVQKGVKHGHGSRHHRFHCHGSHRRPEKSDKLTVDQLCLLAGCLTSQQHASVSQGRICSDNLTCCHTEIEVAYQTFYLTQSQYTDTGPTSPSPDPIMPGAWQGSYWSANFEVTGMTLTGKIRRKRDSNPGSSAPGADALTTRPARRSESIS